ncbi:calmodulin [Strigomonas culicis]|uniref:Calmodulin n=1 Tax=Strigomonas culicis TaxID=28005 RepID=S9UMJ6_9TRYP|nr:calmodulin [Strigomonas culicis]|eukprot:EPY32057.1 calmodulin [Strigomonas culicis]
MESLPADWVALWDVFDEHRSGALPQVDVGHIMRSLGRRHTEAEFRELLQPLPQPVPFDAFVGLMRQPYNGPTEEDLRIALQAFDVGGTGRLKVGELATLLTTLGEKMAETDVRQILGDVPVDAHGCVGVSELVRFLTAPVAAATPEMAELQRQLAREAPA